MNRFLSFLILLVLPPFSPGAQGADRAAKPPNVLVIIIDDLNDWVGCLGGHPQVKSPAIDALAERGMLFTNAHVQATYCGPSRVSFLSGRMPQTTGCRDFSAYETIAALKGHPPFPMHFRECGWQSFGGGKIFHQGTGGGWSAESWDTVLDSGRNPGPKNPIHWQKRVWDWGPIPEKDADMGDYQLSMEVARVLSTDHEKPFFVVAGIRRPHVPLHVPKMWFDLYPENDISLPEVPDDDLEDVPHPEVGLAFHAAPEHKVVVERKLWRSLVQAYLASISFVDQCVAQMMRGLDGGPNKDNTIVVLTSDHGFHLGEKQHWAKRTLWEETTRVPFVVAGPGIRAGTKSGKPVGLIDLYPTLCELGGVSAPAGLDGVSLKPLLDDPDSEWDRPAFTTFEMGDLSVRTEHWRYIRYPDGTEELYDHKVDPNEWENLAQDENYSDVRKRLVREAEKWK
jgi:arylsulfatase A-like enzyme